MCHAFTVLFCLLALASSQSGEEDLVDLTQIPMMPQDYKHKVYSGYLNISPLGNKQLHYFFYER